MLRRIREGRAALARHRHFQYREGLTDFQRVLDSQRALFSQQERLVSHAGRRDAEPDRPLQGDGRRLAGGRAGPCSTTRRAKPWASAATGRTCSTARCRRPTIRIRPTATDRTAMSQERADGHAAPRPPCRTPQPGQRVPASARSSSRLLIVVSLVWYFVGDRLTPYTSQARVQAFVVPVAAEVAGKVLKVHVKNNDEVQPGQPLFDIDPSPTRSRCSAAAPTTSRCASSVKRSRRRRGGGAGRAAGGRRPIASMAESDATRLEQIYKEDPGAISVRRVEMRAGHPRGSAQQGARAPRPTCARRRRPRARPATTTRSCSAPARRSRRPSSTSTHQGGRACARRRSPTCAPTSAISRRPARRR